MPTSKRPTFARRAKLTDPVGVLSIMAILSNNLRSAHARVSFMRRTTIRMNYAKINPREGYNVVGCWCRVETSSRPPDPTFRSFWHFQWRMQCHRGVFAIDRPLSLADLPALCPPFPFQLCFLLPVDTT